MHFVLVMFKDVVSDLYAFSHHVVSWNCGTRLYMTCMYYYLTVTIMSHLRGLLP